MQAFANVLVHMRPNQYYNYLKASDLALTSIRIFIY